jgi:hypothetical protein
MGTFVFAGFSIDRERTHDPAHGRAGGHSRRRRLTAQRICGPVPTAAGLGGAQLVVLAIAAAAGMRSLRMLREQELTLSAPALLRAAAPSGSGHWGCALHGVPWCKPADVTKAVQQGDVIVTPPPTPTSFLAGRGHDDSRLHEMLPRMDRDDGLRWASLECGHAASICD